MAGPFGDTFVEGTDSILELHTPTGPNAGTGWTVTNGQIAVRAATDLAEDTDPNASNQYVMNDDLGTDEMDVQADFTEVLNVGRRGVRARVSTADAQGWEFSWDTGSGGRWLVSDGTASTTAADSWPGGAVTIKAEMRTGSGKLYANGVLKVTHSSNLLSGRTRAGITLLNFDLGGTAHQVDNFLATAASSSTTASASETASTGLTESQATMAKVKAVEGS